MKMAFEGLPEELMTLILVKLPVKSLLRCKCIRKSWYSLINSPSFIHLHRSYFSPQFIFFRWLEEERKAILSFYSYETLHSLGNDFNIPFSNRVTSRGDFGELSLSAPCNGLVCITNHHDQIFICNPALRELRSLFVPPSFCNRSGYHIDSVAFGSDPNTGEYKVLMIGVPYDNSHLYDPDIPDEDCWEYTSEEEDSFGDREAQVYDFNTDSWRETAVVIPSPFPYSKRAVSLNGAFHWCPSRDQYMWDDLNDILTFHISDEVVTESIPLPDFVHNSYMELFVSRKFQLSLIVNLCGEDDAESWGRYEICVMTEYGVKESWTRLCQIGPLPGCYNFPLAFWEEQQQILLNTAEGQLFSCDLQHQNHHLRYFPIYGSFQLYPYSESLVSVNVLP